MHYKQCVWVIEIKIDEFIWSTRIWKGISIGVLAQNQMHENCEPDFNYCPTPWQRESAPDDFLRILPTQTNSIWYNSHLPHPRIFSFWYTSTLVFTECLIQWDDEHQLREQSQLLLIPLWRAMVQLLGGRLPHCTATAPSFYRCDRDLLGNIVMPSPALHWGNCMGK